jgi:hypothetical protein
MLKRLFGAAVAALLLCNAPVRAADYRLDFTVGNMTPTSGTNSAPFDSAIGYAVFSADAQFANWTSLKQFDLTIGDAHYSLSDVGFKLDKTGAFIGGNVDGVDIIFSSTNDFWFDLNSFGSFNFVYTSKAARGFWGGGTVSQTVSAVPEPEALGMYLAGLGLLGFAARRRKA